MAKKDRIAAGKALKQAAQAAERKMGFYRVRNDDTKDTYHSDYEVAFWNPKHGWTILGWDSPVEDAYFTVLGPL